MTAPQLCLLEDIEEMEQYDKYQRHIHQVFLEEVKNKVPRAYEVFQLKMALLNQAYKNLLGYPPVSAFTKEN